MITSINVLWRESFINNMSFDYWEGDFLADWGQFDKSGKVQQYDLPEGTAVKLSCDSDETEKPDIFQNITGLDSSETYTLNVRFRGNVLIKKDGVELYAGNSSEWTVQSFTISGVSNFLLTFSMNNNEDHEEYAYFDYADLSVIDLLPLNINKIRQFEDFERMVEDDLFEFTADSYSLTIKVKQESGYFNLLDLINYPNRIYRFDITFNFDGIEKKMIYFVGQDDNDVDKFKNHQYNYISINLYELQTIFKQNSWYLGRLEQKEAEENEDEAPIPVYRFRTADIVLDSILEKILLNLQELIIKYQIPINDNELIAEELTTDDSTISGNLRVSNIYDYVKIPTVAADGSVPPEGQSSRIFLLAKKETNIVQVWELKNGIDCVLVEEFEDQFADKPGRYSFVHTYFSWPEENEDGDYLGCVWIYRYWYNYQNEISGASRGYKFDLNNTIAKWIESEVAYESPNAYLNLANSGNGSLVPQDSLPLGVNNFTYMADNNEINILIKEPEGNNYVFGGNTEQISLNAKPISFQNSYYVHNFSIADNVYYYLYQFPHHFSLNLDNIVFSELLRELCLTQDSIWYFDYSDGNIKIKFSDKRQIISQDSLTPTILTENKGKKLLRFNSLSSKIFDKNKDRITSYIRYFNQRYGLGRRSYNILCKKFVNVELADKNSYLDSDGKTVNVINLGYSYNEVIGSIEQKPQKRTTIKLFEVINV